MCALEYTNGCSYGAYRCNKTRSCHPGRYARRYNSIERTSAGLTRTSSNLVYPLISIARKLHRRGMWQAVTPEAIVRIKQSTATVDLARARYLVQTAARNFRWLTSASLTFMRDSTECSAASCAPSTQLLVVGARLPQVPKGELVVRAARVTYCVTYV
jgi:hypothetical protein